MRQGPPGVVLGEAERVLTLFALRNLRQAGKVFLVKNVFTLILIVGALGLFSLPFPYVPRQVTLLNFLTIGVPTFLIMLNRGRSSPTTAAHYLREVGSFDLLLECSAEPSVQAGYGGSPSYVLETNLTGTINCLEVARANRADVIFLSTSRVYPIERLRLHGQYRPKPSIAMLRAVLAREGLAGRANAGRAVLVDDSLMNLKAAHSAGFRTVLRIGPAVRRPLAGSAFVAARVRTVRQLSRRLG